MRCGVVLASRTPADGICGAKDVVSHPIPTSASYERREGPTILYNCKYVSALQVKLTLHRTKNCFAVLFEPSTTTERTAQ